MTDSMEDRGRTAGGMRLVNCIMLTIDRRPLVSWAIAYRLPKCRFETNPGPRQGPAGRS